MVIKRFKNVRSSPPYFESKKKELMAMIRQLGIPTLFISLSAAHTKWTELLQAIYIYIYQLGKQIYLFSNWNKCLGMKSVISHLKI